MKLKTIRDLDVKHKRVVVGVDYNVPISSGIVGDPLRIEASFKTIRYLIDQDCSIVLISHLGRPKGAVVPQLSLAPVAKKAGDMLGRPVMFVPECVGPQAEAAVAAMRPGDITLLENLRFHPGEETNDPDFAQQLASHGEAFIDDAFARIHRNSASTTGITKFLPSAAGFLVEKEVEHILGALRHPRKPRVAIVGGAKVSSKIDVLKNLMKHVDRLVIGGAMANTFLAADGHPVGLSKQEPELFNEVHQLIAEAKERRVNLVVPVDVTVAKSLDGGPIRVVDPDDVADDDYIIDAGPKTVALALNPLHFHGSVIWNGPLGITEVPAFAHSTRLLADNIIESGADCVIGGGDTAAFVDTEGLHDKFTWVSTGGGASLELMAGNELPGLAVLQK